MGNQLIEIDGISIEIIRKPIKNMHVRIYPPDGSVRVTAPLKLSLQHIQQQLNSKRAWLHRTRTRLQALPIATEPCMQTGELHYFLGEAYPLTVYENTNQNRLLFTDHHFQLHSKLHATLDEKLSSLKKWYQAQMQSVMPPLIQHWQPVLNVNVLEWGTKSMKTRWGSCNTRKQRIWLNLVLIKKPIECLEYVLVHEMVHLLEPSHNARFHQLMDRYLPDWRIHQKALYMTAN